MESAAHEHHHHAMPTSGRELDAVAFSATLHCLTGCALGEIAGMVIGTALGFSDWGTVGLAVVLAFLFGYTLTSLPLLRAGLALSAVVPIALASDTLSIGGDGDRRQRRSSWRSRAPSRRASATCSSGAACPSPS